MNLVIVESGAKAKKITKDLNSSKKLSHLGKFIVCACFGHVRDLKRKELAIDIEDDFKPVFEITDEKRKTVDELRSKFAQADTVWLASDPDLEGEAIAESLLQVFKVKDYHRVTFNEINQAALERAFLNPRKIDYNLVDAQLTRRIVDRLVGFQISPLLWKKFDYNTYGALSAGRVQSATLHLLIEKENEIISHQKAMYWDFHAKFIFDPPLSDAKKTELALHDKGGNYKITTSPEDVRTFFHSIINDFYIDTITTKNTQEKPKAPFITSTLQQEAHTKFKFAVDKTMQLAQALYEGGHITYLRTDSYSMSDEFTAELKEYIAEKYGDEYVSDTIAKKKASKNAQEAHECIRITHLGVEDLPDEKTFTADHRKLYKLIYERTITCAMTPTIYDELHVDIRDKSFVDSKADLHFSIITKKVKFNGFQIVFGLQNEENDFEHITEQLQATNVTCDSMTAKCNFTGPPSRLSEATLIKTLESEGIGRPSTYATIMNKLKEKNYVVIKNIEGEKIDVVHLTYNLKKRTVKEKESFVTIGGEKDKIVPTEIGVKIDEYLKDDFNYILDRGFTAILEKSLDGIEHGTQDRLGILQTFWSTFEPLISKCKESLPEEKRERRADPMIQGTDISYFLGKKGYVLKKEDRVAFLPSETDIKKLKAADAEALFAFPKFLGMYKKGDVYANKGQYGFYITYKEKNYTAKDYSDDFTIEDAVKIIDAQKERVIVEFSSIGVYNGPYGPYIKQGKDMCSLPSATSPEEVKEMSEKELKALMKRAMEEKRAAMLAKQSGEKEEKKEKKTSKK